MEILLIYLAIAYLVLFLDAAITIGLKYKYTFWKSILGALFFPITSLLLIAIASHVSKDFPSPDTILGKPKSYGFDCDDCGGDGFNFDDDGNDVMCESCNGTGAER